jgi:hypothetical protein
MTYTLSTGSNKKIEVANASTNTETSLEFLGKFKKDFEPIFQQNLIHLLTNCRSKEYTDINTVPMIVGQTVYVRGTPSRMFLCTNDNPKTIEELVLTATDISKYITPNNLPTGNVTIDTTGNTYTANTSNVVDIDGLGPFKYQWTLNGVDITGANKVTYTATTNDIGKTLKVVVSYTDLRKHVESLTSNGVIVDDPTVTYAPSITLPATILDKTVFVIKFGIGTAPLKPGDVVTITIQDSGTYFDSKNITSLLTNNEYSYTIANGLNAGNYTVNITRQPADNNQAHRGTATQAFASIAGQAPATGSIAVTWDNGTATNPNTDSTLTATISNIADINGINQSTVAYTWYRGVVQITNPSTDPTKYKVQAEDLGKDIRAVYTFKDNLGNNENIFSNSVTVAIGQAPASGTLTLKLLNTNTLVANDSNVKDPNVADLSKITRNYTWYRDNVSFVNNSNSYTTIPSDISKTFKVSMSFTDDLGNKETLTSNEFVVPLAQAPATGRAILVQIGNTLTAGYNVADPNVADWPSIVMVYNWYRDNVAFVNNANTYTLTPADISKTFKVSVSFTDDLGNKETLTSKDVIATPEWM